MQIQALIIGIFVLIGLAHSCTELAEDPTASTALPVVRCTPDGSGVYYIPIKATVRAISGIDTTVEAVYQEYGIPLNIVEVLDEGREYVRHHREYIPMPYLEMGDRHIAAVASGRPYATCFHLVSTGETESGLSRNKVVIPCLNLDPQSEALILLNQIKLEPHYRQATRPLGTLQTLFFDGQWWRPRLGLPLSYRLKTACSEFCMKNTELSSGRRVYYAIVVFMYCMNTDLLDEASSGMHEIVQRIEPGKWYETDDPLTDEFSQAYSYRRIFPDDLFPNDPIGTIDRLQRISACVLEHLKEHNLLNCYNFLTYYSSEIARPEPEWIDEVSSYHNSFVDSDPEPCNEEESYESYNNIEPDSDASSAV